jgi:hypothetical protein
LCVTSCTRVIWKRVFNFSWRTWISSMCFSASEVFFDGLYSPWGPWPLFSYLIYSWSAGLLGRIISSSQGQYLILCTVGRTPLTEDQPVARPLTYTQKNTNSINAHRHPCLEWDLNPRSQGLSRRRLFMR